MLNFYHLCFDLVFMLLEQGAAFGIDKTFFILSGADVATSLSKIQDRIQIFFAVLFWMSLFFWASAWDGRNRPDKGSRFRR